MIRKFLISFVVSFIIIFSIFLLMQKSLLSSQASVSSGILDIESDSPAYSFEDQPINSKEELILITVVDSNDVNDKTSRTDTIMLMKSNFDTGQINLLSIPRDTQVVINNRILKINSAHSLGGMAQTLKSVNELLGLNIKDYVKLDYKIVVKLVDIIGGVQVDVPFLMEYKDPTAEPPLDIYLEPGLQFLDGKKAHDFLRWRKNNRLTVSYPEGDIGRIKTQQYFVKELIKQTLNSNDLITKLPSIAHTYFDNVETNLSLSKILKFIKLAKNIDTESILAITLPGKGETINSINYFIHDEKELKDIIDAWFQ